MLLTLKRAGMSCSMCTVRSRSVFDRLASLSSRSTPSYLVRGRILDELTVRTQQHGVYHLFDLNNGECGYCCSSTTFARSLSAIRTAIVRKPCAGRVPTPTPSPACRAILCRCNRKFLRIAAPSIGKVKQIEAARVA